MQEQTTHHPLIPEEPRTPESVPLARGNRARVRGSHVKIVFFNYGIQDRTVGGACDIRGSIRENGPSVFVGSHPHPKQTTAGSAQA
jgi:hypothetical protein